MKIAACLSTAIIAGAMMLPSVASAAPQTTTTRTVTTDNGQVTSRTTVRERHNGWHGRSHWKNQCKTWWKHGRKHRTCKKVRVRW